LCAVRLFGGLVICLGLGLRWEALALGNAPIYDSLREQALPGEQRGTPQ
jgi:hypothetical protein